MVKWSEGWSDWSQVENIVQTKRSWGVGEGGIWSLAFWCRFTTKSSTDFNFIFQGLVNIKRFHVNLFHKFSGVSWRGLEEVEWESCVTEKAGLNLDVGKSEENK